VAVYVVARFCPLALSLLLRQAFLQHARHLFALHLERGADLLGAQAVLLALQERDHLIKRLRDLLG